MATSIGDLLGELQRRAAVTDQPVTAPQVEDATAAVEALGRILAWLAADRVDRDKDSPRRQAVLELAAAVRHLSSPTRAADRSPLTDLAGGAADLAGRLRDEFGAAERWSAAVAIAEAIHTCLDYADRHTGRHAAPVHRRARAAVGAVLQRAAAEPPDPRRRTLLDRPAVGPGTGRTLTAAADAASRLVAAVQHASQHGGITLSDGLTAIAAAHTAAHYAQLLAATEPGVAADTLFDDPADPWRQTARAWQQAHRSLNSFDDGTRARHAAATPLAAAAVDLHHLLRDQLGRVAAPDTLSRRDDLPAVATALRHVSNQLPGLAERLIHAVTAWGSTGQLGALATNLPHTGRSADTYHRRRVVTVDLDDLHPTLTALARAHTLSIHLADQLDRSTSRIGSQPQPYLAATNRLLRMTHDGHDHAANVIAAAGVAAPPTWRLPPPRRAR